MNHEVVAALVAVAAAAMIGLSAVAQRRAALSVTAREAGDPRLILALARRPWWWLGTLSALAGIGLQVLALTLGPLTLVQSVLVVSVIAAVGAEWLFLGHRPTRRVFRGAALTAVGLAAVLAALAPATGDGPGPSLTASFGLGGGWLVLTVLVALLARRLSPRTGALGLAVCTGLGYGISAVQLKQIGMQLTVSPLEPLHHVALYIAIVVGGGAILVSQSALQHADRAAAVMSVILVVDPLVGLVAGPIWFGEHITTAPWALAVGSLGLLAVVFGVRAAHDRTPDDEGPTAPDVPRALPGGGEPASRDEEPGPARARLRTPPALSVGPLPLPLRRPIYLRDR